jgi:hypothetical protein
MARAWVRITAEASSSAMNADFPILKQIYNAFDPFRPLPAGDPAYVNCYEVRGETDIIVELGREILFSEPVTCQLYGGHRGAGKSTELLRFKKYLEDNKCFVVYFGADDEDIDPEDAQYTDILLACTRHLIEALKQANPQPLLNWLQGRWDDLKELALTDIAFDKLTIEGQIAQFGKLTANLRTEPSQRQKIRERVNPYTVTLIEALNQFIQDGKKSLASNYAQLVVIADNLDRIVSVIQEDGRSNHEHIFIDRSEQLKALDCDIFYTVPISMLYSKRAADLRYNYGDCQILPMIMVRKPDNSIYQAGVDKVKEVIFKRINKFFAKAELTTKVFESEQALTNLCLMSGGHVRELMLLVRESVIQTQNLPISERAIQRAITKAKDVYLRTVEKEQWRTLAEVYKSKKLQNDDQYRDLLLNRCLLEYVEFDSQGEMKRWCDVHPLVVATQEFQEVS